MVRCQVPMQASVGGKYRTAYLSAELGTSVDSTSSITCHTACLSYVKILMSFVMWMWAASAWDRYNETMVGTTTMATQAPDPNAADAETHGPHKIVFIHMP
jgi:hypothetical protein